MRNFLKITIAVALLACVGACNSWSGFKADDEMIARVGTAYLYRSELASSMPSVLLLPIVQTTHGPSFQSG